MSSSASTEAAPPKPVLLEEPGTHGAGHQLDGSDLTIAIISTRWYDKEVVQPMVQACKDELMSKGVASDRIKCLQVPGAFELPFAASRMIHAKKTHLDAVICIGCMVKGATMAYEFVSEATAMGLMKLNAKTETPVVCGLLTCHSLDEAKECAKSKGACVVDSEKSVKHCNHGVSWAQEAIELAQLKRGTAQLIEKNCACICHCKETNCKCACHCTQCKCHTCTCKHGTCACSSCFSHQEKTEQSKAKSKMMKQFDQVLCGSASSGAVGMGTCTGCGKFGSTCSCENCKCSHCATKKSGAQSATCTGCGKTGNACACLGCNCVTCSTETSSASTCNECGKRGNACVCTDCKCSSCSTKKSGADASQKVATCGGCQQPGCVDCNRGHASGSSGYHGRSSAPLKGEPNSETLP